MANATANALRAGQAIIELKLAESKLDIDRQLSHIRNTIQTGLTSLNRRMTAFALLPDTSLMRWRSLGSIFGTLTMRARSLTASLFDLRTVLVGGAAVAAAAYPVKLAANFETASVQLGVLMRDEKAARELLKDLQKFSGVSGVPLGQLAQASALLMKMRVPMEQVGVHTKAMAAIAGDSPEEFDKLALAFAQISSAGRLTGEEWRQLKNTAFTALPEIADITGESLDEVKKRMEAGKISFQEVANAMQQAVGPGGRFAGLLERRAQTTAGQFNIALAKLREAAIQLGEKLLPPINEFLRMINQIIPKVGEFAAELLGTTEFGTRLSTVFSDLKNTAMATFAAIGQAMSSGEIKLAAEVLFAGLNLAWLQGIDNLKHAMKGLDIHQDLIDLTFDVMAAWERMFAALLVMAEKFKRAWTMGPSGFMTGFNVRMEELSGQIDKFFADTEEQRLGIDLRTARRVAALTGDHANKWRETSDREKEIIDDLNQKLKAIEDSRDIAHEDTGVKVISDETKEAAKHLQDLSEIARKHAHQEAVDFGLGKQSKGGPAGLEKAKKIAAVEPQAFLDTRLAKQALGGNIPQEQLDELRRIRRNQENRGPAEIPVV